MALVALGAPGGTGRRRAPEQPGPGLAALLLLLIWSLAALDVRADEPGCVRRIPAERPSWITSAAWAPGGETLAVIDRVGGRVLFYRASGEVVGQVLRPGPGRTDLATPMALRAMGGELRVLDGTDQLKTLDAEGTVRPSHDLRGRAVVLDFVEAPAAEALVVFGLWRGEGSASGFLRLRGDPIEQVKLLHEVKPGSTTWQLTSLCRPTLARSGGHVYALTFDGRPAIRELDTGRSLGAFPVGFSEPPTLPGRAGPELIAQLYALLERSAVPVQLHGRGERLFLVTRHPTESGQTRWEIHRIDPGEDRLEATLRLPTTAPHLLIAPGSERWAVLEFGHVEDVGVRKLTGLVTLPSRWLEGAEPGPLAGDRRVACD